MCIVQSLYKYMFACLLDLLSFTFICILILVIRVALLLLVSSLFFYQRNTHTLQRLNIFNISQLRLWISSLNIGIVVVFHFNINFIQMDMNKKLYNYINVQFINIIFKFIFLIIQNLKKNTVMKNVKLKWE